MSLCPEAEERALLTDAEFWEHVFNIGPDIDDDFDEHPAVLTECTECGEFGACAYDDRGRALIHIVQDPEGEPK